MKSSVQLLWITSEIEDSHKARVRQMENLGINTTFYNPDQDLSEVLAKHRYSIAIVSDNGDSIEVSTLIRKLTMMPGMQGTRFVLSIETRSQRLLRLASASSFREMLPEDLDPSVWLQRFSTATLGAAPAATRNDRITPVNEEGVQRVPCRIAALDESRIELECRDLVSDLNSAKIEGPIAKKLGLKALLASGFQHMHTGLTYRFSRRFVANWRPFPAKATTYKSVINEVQAASKGQRYRVLVAARDGKIRRAVVQGMGKKGFDVRFAIRLTTLEAEAHYLIPDVVVLESDLFRGRKELVKTLLNTLNVKARVYFIGESDAISAAITEVDFPDAHRADSFGKEFAEEVAREFSQAEGKPVGASPNNLPVIATNHMLSYGEIVIPTRLLGISRRGIVIEPRHSVANFSMSTVDSESLRSLTTDPIYFRSSEGVMVDPMAGSDLQTVFLEAVDIPAKQFEEIEIAEPLSEEESKRVRERQPKELPEYRYVPVRKQRQTLMDFFRELSPKHRRELMLSLAFIVAAAIGLWSLQHHFASLGKVSFGQTYIDKLRALDVEPRELDGIPAKKGWPFKE